MTCLDIWWKIPHFCILNFPFKISLFEKLYQTLVTVFHHNIKNLEVRQNYSCHYTSHFRLSSWCLICDETLCLVFDILHERYCKFNVHTLYMIVFVHHSPLKGIYTFEFFFWRSNTLFSMWNTYEARLPPAYYQDKLLSTGDFLFSVKVLYVHVCRCRVFMFN